MNDRTFRQRIAPLMTSLFAACQDAGPSPADARPTVDAPSSADTRAALDAATFDMAEASLQRDATLALDAVVADEVGAVEVGASPGAPRPIAPLSTATVGSRRPLLRWLLADGADGAHVEVCRDRACSRVITAFDAIGASGRPLADLPRGTAFWRLRGRAGAREGSAVSPTWQFVVGARDAPIDTSWGVTADVNGDGHADLVAGNPSLLAGPLEARGRVYVYLGGSARLPADPSATMRGPVGATARFGALVTCAGDVDGDGFVDLLIGDSAFGPASEPFGVTHLYRGGPGGLADTAAQSLPGPGDVVTSVAPVGDVNGDGYADVVMGTGFQFAEAPPMGVFLYLGSASGLATSSALRFDPPPSKTDRVSAAGAGVGDVNGDGYADVATRWSDASGTSDVQLHFGRAGGPPMAPSVRLAVGVTGELPRGAGDLDGDGFADVILRTGPTALSVYRGSATGTAGEPELLTTPNRPGAILHVAFAGDLDADGHDDLALGYTSDSVGGDGSGHASIFFGGVRGATALTGTLLGDAQFGSAVGAIGDVDGDGYDDLAVGTPRPWHTQDPAIDVYFGGSRMPESLTRTHLLNPRGPFNFGESIAGVGDINRDGYDDLAIAADGRTTGILGGRARVHVYLGSATGIPSAPSATITLANSRPSFMDPPRITRVLRAGDVNGDGYGDLLVGIPQSARLIASLLLGGGAGLRSVPAATLVFETSTLSGLASVAGGADFNRDGFADVALGGLDDVHIHAGAAGGFSDAPTATLSRELGMYLAPVATDINGDGYGDLSFPCAGQVCVYHGSPTGLPTSPSQRITAPVRVTTFASAGDVNRDGAADVLVGTPSSVLVYLGARDGLSVSPSLSWTPPAGESVVTAAGVGDVNGDGYADILVGTSSATGSNHASLLLGASSGPSMIASARIEPPDATELNFGTHIAGAGDVNHDGYEDVVIRGGSANSRSPYLYLGAARGLSPSPDLRLTDGDEDHSDSFGGSFE